MDNSKERTALLHSLTHISENADFIRYQMSKISDMAEEMKAEDHDLYMNEGEGVSINRLRNHQDMLIECIGAATMDGLKNINGAAPKFFIDQKRSFFLMEQNFDLDGPKVPTKFDKQISDFEGLESFDNFIHSSKHNKQRTKRRRPNR